MRTDAVNRFASSELHRSLQDGGKTPLTSYRGRDEIYRIAGLIKAGHPEYRYQTIAPPEELGNGGRVRWVSGRPGHAPSYAGTDFIIARDGRIAAVYRFFDKLYPELAHP